MRLPAEPIAANPIALQLWTIRDAFAADPDGALAAVKAAGFSAVELAPLPPGISAARLAELLARHALSVVSVHGDLPTSASIGPLADLARACHSPKLIWHGWPRDPRFDSPQGLRGLIAAVDVAGALARDHGLAFGLHNHWWEFEAVGGEWPIRQFHDSLHPDIFWQLDVYWAQTAGADPASVLAGLGPRARSIHWKDGPCVHGRPMTALGRGVVDISRILAALTRPHDFVVELDECASDPLEAARHSRITLESLSPPAG